MPFRYFSHSVAVTGISVRLPGAETVDEFDKLLRNKCCCVAEIPEQRKALAESYLNIIEHGDVQERRYPKAAYLKDIDYFDNRLFGISPTEAITMDPNHRLFLLTAVNALADAGLLGKRLESTCTGVFFASSNSLDYLNMVTAIRPDLEQIAVIGNLPPFAPGRLAYRYNLCGPNITINTLCSSSLVAVHEACKSILSGECDTAVVGSSRIIPLPVAKSKLMIQSSDGYTRAFSDDSDGTGGGEGCIVIVLKNEQQALRDGDPIYAMISGSAINHDGYCSSLTGPNADAQTAVIQAAWDSAGIQGNDIGYIEAHGTGTKLGDPIEIKGITQAFTNIGMTKPCPIGSVKTNFGHLDCVAGLLGLVKAILSVNKGVLYPQLFFERPNRYISFEQSKVYVNTDYKAWDTDRKKRIAGVSSFSFSGTNCHMIVTEVPSAITVPSSKQEQFLFSLSADSLSTLMRVAAQYREYTTNIDVPLADICHTAALRCGNQTFKLQRTIYDKKHLLETLDTIIHCLQPPYSTVELPADLWFSNQKDKAERLISDLLRFLPLEIPEEVGD
mgnify:FL=1